MEFKPEIPYLENLASDQKHHALTVLKQFADALKIV